MFTNDLKKALEEAKGDADQKSIQLSEVNKKVIVVDKMIKVLKQQIEDMSSTTKQEEDLE